VSKGGSTWTGGEASKENAERSINKESSKSHEAEKGIKTAHKEETSSRKKQGKKKRRVRAPGPDPFNEKH